MKNQFITDNSGKKISVIIPIKEYQKMMEELEDIEDVKLYDESVSSKDLSMPLDKAFKLIESKRKKR